MSSIDDAEKRASESSVEHQRPLARRRALAQLGAAVGGGAAALAGSGLLGSEPAAAQVPKGPGPTQFDQDVYFKSGRPWYDVRAFGAKGDGSTDDTWAIRGAVAAASASGATGGIVFLPPGTYLCTSGAINLASNVWMRGAGVGTSIVQAGSGNDPVVSISGSANAAVTDLQLGYQGVTPGAISNILAALSVENATDILVREVVITGGNHGIAAAVVSRMRVIDATVTGVLGNGIQLYGVEHVVVTGCYVAGAFNVGATSDSGGKTLVGIAVQGYGPTGTPIGSSNVVISNNTVEKTGDDCILVVSYGAYWANTSNKITGRCQNISITGNTVHNGRYRGIVVAGGSEIAISGNTASLTRSPGIMLTSESDVALYTTYDVENVSVTANSIANATLGQDAAPGGLSVVAGAGPGTVHNIALVGNAIEATGVSPSNGQAPNSRDGIYLGGGSDATVSANTVMSSTDSGIAVDNWIGIVISGNRVINCYRHGISIGDNPGSTIGGALSVIGNAVEGCNQSRTPGLSAIHVVTRPAGVPCTGVVTGNTAIDTGNNLIGIVDLANADGVGAFGNIGSTATGTPIPTTIWPAAPVPLVAQTLQLGAGSSSSYRGSTISSGAGAPSGNGTPGDLYVRIDTPGTGGQRLYMCSGGANWIAIV